MNEKLLEGYHCAECGRWAKATQRPFNVTMVRALRWIVAESGPDLAWVNIPALCRAQGKYDFSKQYSTVKYWGFLEHKPNEGHTKTKESGIWRPTQKALAFLAGEIPVRKAVIYNDRLLGWAGGEVFVDEIHEGFRWPVG